MNKDMKADAFKVQLQISTKASAKATFWGFEIIDGMISR